METSLVTKVRQGIISKDRAREFSFRPDIFDQLMEGG